MYGCEYSDVFPERNANNAPAYIAGLPCGPQATAMGIHGKSRRVSLAVVPPAQGVCRRVYRPRLYPLQENKACLNELHNNRYTAVLFRKTREPISYRSRGLSSCRCEHAPPDLCRPACIQNPIHGTIAPCCGRYWG